MRVLCLLLILLAGCSGRAPRASVPATAGPRIERVSQGKIDVTLSITPGEVDLARDSILTIDIAAPSEIDIVLPPLEDRVQGFIVSSTYDQPPLATDGRTTWSRRARLTPLVAEEHRLAPMAIRCRNLANSPATESWMATPPVVLEVLGLREGAATAGVADTLAPRWVYPPFRTVIKVSGLVVLGLIMLAGVVWLLTRLHREAVLRSLSPRERAMRELRALLRRDLPGRDQVKLFYLELTMIVRRYIERAHGIRAPEQTTEEFLADVAQSPRFDEATIKRLSAFLTAADLVKFAGYTPEQDAIEDATGTARDYVSNDPVRRPDDEDAPKGGTRV